MSKKQLNRHAVILRVIDGLLGKAEAAVSLGISDFQVIRLKKRVVAEGTVVLIHKHTNRKPPYA